VGRIRRGHVFSALIAELRQVDIVEKALPGSKKDWGNRKMHFVYESAAKVLLDGGYSTAESDILTLGGVCGLLKCRVDTTGNEMKHRATVHGDRFAGVVGEHEYRGVVGWIVAPPSLPSVVRPRSPDWTEHVATQDRRTDMVEPAGGEVVINARRAAIAPKHPLKCAGGEGPLVQREATDPKRVVQVLVRARAVAIEGYREAVHAQLHDLRAGPAYFAKTRVAGVGVGTMSTEVKPASANHLR